MASNKIKLVCLGAKNPEIIRMVKAIQKTNPGFELAGFIDNDKSKWGNTFFGYPVYGGIGSVKELTKTRILFCNLITGDTIIRYETTKKLIAEGAELINLIYPKINMEMVEIGVGNYIQENVILQAGVSIGDNASIHMGSLIGHESKVGDSVFIAHGCNISGEVTIEDGVFVGTGATILPRLTIGKWSTIGAGSVIIEDIPPYSVVVGNPGRIIKQTDTKYQNGSIF